MPSRGDACSFVDTLIYISYKSNEPSGHTRPLFGFAIGSSNLLYVPRYSTRTSRYSLARERERENQTANKNATVGPILYILQVLVILYLGTVFEVGLCVNTYLYYENEHHH